MCTVRSALIPQRIARKVLLAAMVTINVLPGLWINKGKFVGRVADYRPILVVDRLEGVDEGAVSQVARIGKAAQDPCFWPGESCKRVEVKKVD